MARKRFPWLKLKKKTEEEPPLEPPVWLNDHSNGEYYHQQTPYERKLKRAILEKADENARRLGLERRDFLASAMGMATSLYMMNACSSADEGEKKKTGGNGEDPKKKLCASYDVGEEEMFDEAAACEALGGNEFIFDIQTHHFDPEGEWVEKNIAYKLFIDQIGGVDSMTFDRYIELMFCDSDTTMAALSTWPAVLCSETRTTGCGLPLPNDSVADSRNLANIRALATQRVVNHCQVMPNDIGGLENQLDIMTRIYCEHGLAAWKVYPAFGPDGKGYWMDDDIGRAVIEKGLELGVRTFCIHKGLPIPGFDVDHNFPTEIGRIAKDYPDGSFIVYHSAIQAGQSALVGFAQEGAYDESDMQGTNTLIKSLLDNGIGPNQNVYGELGSAFSAVRNNPTMAAHFIGKLLKYVGEDNVCWGTDAILGGGPQAEIESFRALDIPQSMQEEFGYPALTAEVKAKIFGLNAARVYGVDPDLKRCQADSCVTAMIKRNMDAELGPRRWAFKQPLGPKTKQQFATLARKQIAQKRPG